ncbi:hypothetical protein [Bradyrhizobium sp.]
MSDPITNQLERMWGKWDALSTRTQQHMIRIHGSVFAAAFSLFGLAR